MTGSLINYADWIRAASNLQINTPSERERLARVLGLPWQSTPHSRGTAIGNQLQDNDSPSSQVKSDDAAIVEPVRDNELNVAEKEPTTAPLLTPQSLSPVTIGELKDEWKIEHFAPFSTESVASEFAVEPPIPLVEPSRMRGVIDAATSVRCQTKRCDIRYCLRVLERGNLLLRFPFRSRLKLAARVQILVDQTSRLHPFVHDLDAIQGDISRWVGGSTSQLLHFSESPFNGVITLSKPSTTREVEYSLPSPNSPIVIFSDCGLGAGPLEHSYNPNWVVQLATEAAKTGSHVFVVAPVPANRVPIRWRTIVNWLTWDRSLTYQAVLRSLNRTSVSMDRK